ncbi:MAG TPA: hypothetical protein VLI05_06580 [Candidatus Saccharimonadia bacterium]|nr:hypothetical protein [Candidatus Saccharimonadia bacterium]
MVNMPPAKPKYENCKQVEVKDAGTICSGCAARAAAVTRKIAGVDD